MKLSVKTLLTFMIIVMVITSSIIIIPEPTLGENNKDGSPQQNRARSTIFLQADKIKKDVVPNLSGTRATVKYTIYVWNFGQDSDMFDITETNDHGFDVELSPTITNKINQDDSTQVTVKITVDNKAPMSTSDYNTVITVTFAKSFR